VRGLAIGLGRLLIIALISAAAFGELEAAAPDPGRTDAYLFWRTGCPYCERAQSFLMKLQEKIPNLNVVGLEVSGSEANRAMFITISEVLGIERPVVPIVLVGERAFVGFLDDRTTGQAIRQAILHCRAYDCPDLLREARVGSSSSGVDPHATERSPPTDSGTDLASDAAVPETIRLPLFGEVSTSTLSLPLLTVVLGAVDGFNPCAMWVLVFLIGLLLGLEDHRRIWILGGTFLLASAAVYFLFMAAWLNVLLFLGALLWVRLAVGLVALGGGAFYLREFVLGNEAVCKVTRPESRRRIVRGLTNAVRERRLLLALGGIILLAFAVDLIVLICSAGIPAVYTQVLSLTDMPTWRYYLYLLLYILVFLLDDVVVFATAILTLQAAGLTGKYTRYSHLIGGLVLCGVGALLLLRPEWMTFG
jgi:thiol-disulfide isomerase/thioredoxin